MIRSFHFIEDPLLDVTNVAHNILWHIFEHLFIKNTYRKCIVTFFLLITYRLNEFHARYLVNVVFDIVTNVHIARMVNHLLSVNYHLC